jgi:hypothetical protein
MRYGPALATTLELFKCCNAFFPQAQIAIATNLTLMYGREENAMHLLISLLINPTGNVDSNIRAHPARTL